MRHNRITPPVYVIKAEDLPVLRGFKPKLPEPLDAEWINRGTNQKLRPSTVQMLRRTSPGEGGSPSIARLHQSAGLRVVFSTEAERDLFARSFVAACARASARKWYTVAGLFSTREAAERVAAHLISSGISEKAISLLWRPADTVDAADLASVGHSKLSVAASVAGGGIAGGVFGVALLMIPGVGPLAAAGAIAASAVSSVAAISVALGATGGAIARMLTDLDVDGRDADYFERQIRLGKVFVSVDTRIAGAERETAEEIIARNGGIVPPRN